MRAGPEPLATASSTSIEVVKATSSVTESEDEKRPPGECSTKPRSSCTGPPNMIGWSTTEERKPGASFRSTRSNRTSIVMSVGLLMTTPSTPFSLCSQT